MRNWIVAAVLLTLVSGCMAGAGGPKDPSSASFTPEPLPPPDSRVHPDDLTGREVEQEPGVDSSKPLSWRQECIRQWSSLAYHWETPPVVHQKPCMFFPTANGTMYYHLVKTTTKPPRQAWSQGLPRADGFFDWTYLAPGTKDLYYAENGTTEPRLIAAGLPIVWEDGTPDADLSAVRLSNGAIHVLIRDNGAGLLSPGALIHVWWTGEGDANQETMAGDGLFNVPAVRGATSLVAAMNSWDPVMMTGSIYWSQEGAFQRLPIPMTLYDLWVTPSNIYACAATGAHIFLVTLTFIEGAPFLEIEPVGTSPIGAVGFFCEVTFSKFGSLIVTLTLTEHPNPLGDVVAIKTPTGWVYSDINFMDLFGSQDLGEVGGIPYYTGSTGNGTGTGDWQEGTSVFAPDVSDLTAPWEHVWGHYAFEQVWFVPDVNEARLLMNSQGWLNPPFRYDPGSFVDGVQHGAAIIELPSNALRG